MNKTMETIQFIIVMVFITILALVIIFRFQKMEIRLSKAEKIIEKSINGDIKPRYFKNVIIYNRKHNVFGKIAFSVYDYNSQEFKYFLFAKAAGYETLPNHPAYAIVPENDLVILECEK